MNQVISNFCCSSFFLLADSFDCGCKAFWYCAMSSSRCMSTRSSLNSGTGRDRRKSSASSSSSSSVSSSHNRSGWHCVGVAYVRWSIRGSASSWSSVVRWAAVDCSFSSFVRSTPFGPRRYLQEKSQSPFLFLMSCTLTFSVLHIQIDRVRSEDPCTNPCGRPVACSSQLVFPQSGRCVGRHPHPQPVPSLYNTEHSAFGGRFRTHVGD